jgi:hypothetical protein
MIHLIWMHFIGDFVFQTDNMAINKSKSIKWLTAHAIAYCLPFMLISVRFALINCTIHWIIDFITSRITAYFNSNGYRSFYYKTIGFDQALHLTILVLTYTKFVYK